MADTTPSEGFSDIVNKIAEADISTAPRKRSQPTTATSLIKTAVSDYPRATATAVIGGTAGYKAVAGWRQAYKEGIDVIKNRLKEEAKAAESLGAKGMGGIARLKGTNKEIRALANEYAIEKTFAGGLFQNSQAKARLADLKTPRVILQSETVPLVNFNAQRAPMFGEGSMVMNTRPSPFRIAVDPKQVTTEVANAIPKLGIAPYTQSETINMANPETWQGALQAGAGRAGQEGRIAGLPKYAPSSGIKPSIPKRIAEISTGGKLGKANVALEGIGLVADILNSEGDIQRAYREGDSYYGPAGGIVLGGLKTASRAGRGATNALTLGAPEYLGLYDTIDLMGVESEAKRRYLQNRGSMKLPVRKVGDEYEPIKDNPYLQMFEAQVASERGIQTSPMTQKFYKGPEYDYKVINGKLVNTMKPEYASIAEAQSIASLDRYNQSRPVLNIDPSLGNMGYQFRRPEAFNFGDYTDYMQNR